MNRDEIERVTIKRVDPKTNESQELTITDAEECEEISAITSVIVLADFRRKLFKALFIALCIVIALMLIAYVVRYEMLLNVVVSAGVCNLVFLQRYYFWKRCMNAAMIRSEQFFENHISGNMK